MYSFQRINFEYNKLKRGKLTDLIKCELSGEFATLLRTLLVPRCELNLYYFRESMRTGEFEVAIDILCTMSNYEINQLKETHFKR